MLSASEDCWNHLFANFQTSISNYSLQPERSAVRDPDYHTIHAGDACLIRTTMNTDNMIGCVSSPILP